VFAVTAVVAASIGATRRIRIARGERAGRRLLRAKMRPGSGAGGRCLLAGEQLGEASQGAGLQIGGAVRSVPVVDQRAELVGRAAGGLPTSGPPWRWRGE
jgi:hypothetical protein